MSFFDRLGVKGDERGVLLVSPPDDVLTDAAALSPRPSVASTLQTAEPSGTIVWWPSPRLIEPAYLSRLRWMVSIGGGVAWVVLEGDTAGMEDTLRLAAAPAGLALEERVAAGAARVALRFSSEAPPGPR